MNIVIRDHQEIMKLTLAILIALLTYMFLLVGDSDYFSLVFALSIFSVYAIMKPVHILNPANMVAAFSILFFVIPFIVDDIYSAFNIAYILPWGRLWDWQSLEAKTYGEALGIFFILFIMFCVLNQDREDIRLPTYHVQTSFLVLTVIITILSVFLFIQISGGIYSWLFNYKETYLLGRHGNGAINFFNIMMGNISVFLLGLKYRETMGFQKFALFLYSIGLILLFAYVQGLKSRLLVLLIIFWSCALFSTKFTWPKIFISGILFVVLMYFVTYVRSEGFYSSPRVFLEYTMTYFNVYPLHDLIVQNDVLAWFSTTNQLLAKPAEIIGFSQNAEFDLNVMLTKEYFPNDWETMKATQQWPLITDMRFNYYGFWGGWLPLLIYVSFLVYLYRKAKRGSAAFLLVFILEFFRLFSVMRGTLIPWQVFVYIPMYIFSFMIVKLAITFRKLK